MNGSAAVQTRSNSGPAIPVGSACRCARSVRTADRTPARQGAAWWRAPWQAIRAAAGPAGFRRNQAAGSVAAAAGRHRAGPTGKVLFPVYAGRVLPSRTFSSPTGPAEDTPIGNADTYKNIKPSAAKQCPPAGLSTVTAIPIQNRGAFAVSLSARESLELSIPQWAISGAAASGASIQDLAPTGNYPITAGEILDGYFRASAAAGPRAPRTIYDETGRNLIALSAAPARYRRAAAAALCTAAATSRESGPRYGRRRGEFVGPAEMALATQSSKIHTAQEPSLGA